MYIKEIPGLKKHSAAQVRRVYIAASRPPPPQKLLLYSVVEYLEVARIVISISTQEKAAAFQL
jgi:hypothetical protein